MESEIINFGKVWLSVLVSLWYCYILGEFVKKGIPRLVGVLPIVCLFLSLPLRLSSIHLGGTTAFFVTWLANFKLLLFAFGKGPLCSDPSISLGRFLAVACLPIKIQHGKTRENASQSSPQNGRVEENPVPKKPKNGKKSPRNYAIKALLLAMLVRIYDYSDHIHPQIIMVLYCFHVYFCLEIILAMAASLARAFLGMELEPQFDEPYLATSLQDFWGRRWNIMVTSILRPTVYEPVLAVAARITGRKWAPLPAVLGTFLVSAIMHELIFYYLGRVNPTWEITWFFVLHGLSLAIEIGLKKALTGKFRLHRMISGPLTVGFVMFTGLRLFFPQLLRCKADKRALEEYAAVGAFVKNVGSVFCSKSMFNASRSWYTFRS
ncbi:hypothetical protein UlMin_018035 [Ulmus minor]